MVIRASAVYSTFTFQHGHWSRPGRSPWAPGPGDQPVTSALQSSALLTASCRQDEDPIGFSITPWGVTTPPTPPFPHARALSSLNLVKKRDYSQSNLIRISLAPSFSPSWNQCCCLWPRCYLLITKYDQHFHFWDDEYMKFRTFEPRNEEINEEKIFAVKDATYWDAKRKPEKIQACLICFAESSGILNFNLSNHCTQHMPIEGLPLPRGNTRGESSWKDKTTVARQFL